MISPKIQQDKLIFHVYNCVLGVPASAHFKVVFIRLGYTAICVLAVEITRFRIYSHPPSAVIKTLVHFHNTSYPYNGFSIFVFYRNASRYPFTWFASTFAIVRSTVTAARGTKTQLGRQTIMRKKNWARNCSTFCLWCSQCTIACHCFFIYISAVLRWACSSHWTA